VLGTPLPLFDTDTRGVGYTLLLQLQVSPFTGQCFSKRDTEALPNDAQLANRKKPQLASTKRSPWKEGSWIPYATRVKKPVRS